MLRTWYPLKIEITSTPTVVIYLQDVPDISWDLQTEKASRQIRQGFAGCRLRVGAERDCLLQLPLESNKS